MGFCMAACRAEDKTGAGNQGCAISCQLAGNFGGDKDLWDLTWAKPQPSKFISIPTFLEFPCMLRY